MVTDCRISGAIAACTVACCWSLAAAQTYPDKPIRIIAPFPAGGGTDIFARMMAQKLTAAWGQQAVVDNRVGAAGMIGSGFAARAAPDGYTLLLTTLDTLAIIPHITRKPLYDSLRDFAPIILIASAPNVLVVHPSIPARTVRDLIALAKSRPGELNYASNGFGTLSHLTGELFKLQSGINLVHIPYNGGPPAVLGVVTGQAAMLFTALPTALPLVRAGKMRALAVTGLQRVDMAKDLPTAAETLAGFESVQRWGLFAPSALPADLITKIHREVTRSLGDEDIKAAFAAQGAERVGGTPGEFAAFLRSDFEKWGKVVAAAGVRPE